MSNNMRRWGFAIPTASAPSLVLALAIAMASGLLLAISSDVTAAQSQIHERRSRLKLHALAEGASGSGRSKPAKGLERKLFRRGPTFHVVSVDRFVSTVYPGLRCEETPRSPESISARMISAEFKKQVTSLGVRYLALVGGKAEGVKTEEQSRLLRLLNCDEMQGYLFSKPLPCQIFEEQFLVPLSAR
jgi:hypothetical protein